jgi:glycosyltransferase involved in cell wall biosynthesis
MKTVVCHVSTLTIWGGVERMLFDFLGHASQRRFRHLVVCPSGAPEIVRTVRELGITVFQPQRHCRYDPFAVYRTARWLRAQRVDVVHSYNVFANCWGGVVSALAGVRTFVGGEHGTVWFTKPPLAWLERLVYYYAKLVIANSNASKYMLTCKRGVNAEKIKVIHNGIPFALHTSGPRPKLEQKCAWFTVGTVGRLDTPKGYFTLLDAAKLIVNERQDVRFVIVGDGPLRRDLERHANSLGISGFINFTGWRQDARGVLASFDVYVSTSVYESFGNTLVEAALAKKPVIAPRIDGIPEVVQHGKTGILLEPSEEIYAPVESGASPLAPQVVVDGALTRPKTVSPAVLAQTICDLLDRPGWRRALGEAGFERAKRLFSIERYAAELEETYLALTEGTPNQ